MLIIFGVEWRTNNLEKYNGSILNVSQGSVAMSVSGIKWKVCCTIWRQQLKAIEFFFLLRLVKGKSPTFREPIEEGSIKGLSYKNHSHWQGATYPAAGSAFVSKSISQHIYIQQNVRGKGPLSLQ
jgi:hypothetical protein